MDFNGCVKRAVISATAMNKVNHSVDSDDHTMWSREEYYSSFMLLFAFCLGGVILCSQNVSAANLSFCVFFPGEVGRKLGLCNEIESQDTR